MKFAFILLVIISLSSSCSKDKNCTCQHGMNGINRAISSETAKKECSELNSTTYSENQDTVYTLVCTEE